MLICDFLYHADKMKKQKINLMMHVEFMAPLRSTKWLAIFTSLLASKYSFMLTEWWTMWLIPLYPSGTRWIEVGTNCSSLLPFVTLIFVSKCYYPIDAILSEHEIIFTQFSHWLCTIQSSFSFHVTFRSIYHPRGHAHLSALVPSESKNWAFLLLFNVVDETKHNCTGYSEYYYSLYSIGYYMKTF